MSKLASDHIPCIESAQHRRFGIYPVVGIAGLRVMVRSARNRRYAGHHCRTSPGAAHTGIAHVVPAVHIENNQLVRFGEIRHNVATRGGWVRLRGAKGSARGQVNRWAYELQQVTHKVKHMLLPAKTY